MVLKLLSKLNNKHFFSLASNVAMSILAMVSMAILYRYMPSGKELDTWIIFQTFFFLMETGRQGFLTTATVKFYAGASKERSDEVIGSSWYLGIIITGVLLLINIPTFFLSGYIQNNGFSFFFKWFGVTSVLSLPAIIANCALQAQSRFERLLYMRLVTQLSFIALIIYFIVTSNLNLQTVLFSYLVSNALTSIFLLITGWSQLSALSKKTKKCVRELFDFGKYTVAGNINSYLLRSSDLFIIGIVMEKEAGAIAAYKLGLSLLEIIEIPLRSFVATAMPTLSAAYNRDDRKGLIYTMQKYAGAITYLLIPVCLGGILLADVAVYIFAHNKHNVGPEAANVLRIFLTFALLFPADRFLALSLDAIHKPNVNSVKIFIMLIVNVVGDLIALAIYKSVYSVALATLLPTLVGVIVGYRELKKYEPFHMRQIFVVGLAEAKDMIRRTLKFKHSVS